MVENNNIPKIAYKDFLINQKQLPLRTDKNYIDFWLKHINFCKSGVSVGGIYISGWLYWHTNFFKVTIKEKDEYGNTIVKVRELDFRDNEFYFDTAFTKTDSDDKKPIAAVGTRRFGKTVLITSRIAYKAFIFQNTHAILVGASTSDINNITKYFDEYYEKRQDCFSDLMKFGDWTKTGADVEIAFNKRVVSKDKKAINPITSKLMEIGSENKYVFSRIAVRNLEHGQVKSKEELLAGITPTEVILDEVGKYKFLKQYAALLPALESDFGKSCTVILCATGGDIDNSVDVEKVFLQADDFNFYSTNEREYLNVINEEYFKYKQISDLKVGLFVPAEMSVAGGKKIPVPLSEYIKKTYTKQDLKDLEGFNILVTDWDNAKEKIEKIIGLEKKKSDSEYKKAQMYYPFQPEDCFLYSGTNPFPAEEARKMQNIIKEKGIGGNNYVLTQRSDGFILLNETDKAIIDEYPYEGGSHDAPVVILEPPIAEPKNIKRGTYVAGFDGYKVEESQTTDSVGSIYIYKRKIGVNGVQDEVVAYYSSRPSRFEDFHMQVFLLIKLYNAELLPETDSNLYNFLKSKNALGYLADCKSLVEGITPNSKAYYNYGLPATKKNQEHYMKLIVDYTTEDILQGYDEDGNGIYVKGIYRIKDPMLLEEMIKFGKHKNYDRIVAFGHALAWDFEQRENKIFGGEITDDDKKPHVESILNKIKNNRTKWR
jgi:hypothetical protein